MGLSFEKYKVPSEYSDLVHKYARYYPKEHLFLNTKERMKAKMPILMEGRSISSVAEQANVSDSSVEALIDKGYAPLPDIIQIMHALGAQVDAYPPESML